MISHTDINQKVNQAQEQQRNKQYNRAEQTYLELINIIRHPDIMHMYGNLLLETKQFTKAATIINNAIQINPKSAAYHSTLGLVFKNSGDLNSSIKSFREAISISPSFAPAYFNLGQIYRANKNWSKAMSFFKKGLSFDKKNLNAYLDIGNLLRDQLRWDEAIEFFHQALLINPNFARAHYNIALTQRDKGKHQLAFESAERSLDCYPRNPKAALLKGELLEHGGDITAAIQVYRDCLEMDNQFTEAYWSIGNISRNNFSDSDIRNMSELLMAILPDSKKVYLYFSLAKAYEECGDFAKAFWNLSKGNELKNLQLEYNKEQHRVDLETIANTFSRKSLETLSQLTNNKVRPIFVLGIPRSGTSLVEQILSSHSQVSGGGELNTMANILFKVLPQITGVSWTESLNMLDQSILEKLASTYINQNKALIESNNYFTDKLPFNYIIIGLISVIFPNAKFIHIYKNPIDSCLSCYKQLFTAGQEFSYSLENLAEYYLDYQKLMRHWIATLPAGKIHNISYEELVEVPETEIRDLLKFVDIPFENECLDFHKTTRKVSTASSGQVRQPLFKSALARWKNYQPYLKTLLETLPKEQRF